MTPLATSVSDGIDSVSYERPLKDLSEEDLRWELVEINRQIGITAADVGPSVH